MYTYIGISVLLTVVAGFMSGLTVGLASIDKLDIELMKMTGSPDEKKSAVAIEKVVQRHHWMLCTLLLCNAGCMEALPIFLDKLMPETIAIIVSVTCVLFFGEIIPQALATGPKQMKIAELSCPVVFGFMVVTAPLSWPLGKLLDCVLGGDHGPRRFNNKQLRYLLKEHVVKALEATINVQDN
jgi:metal transporter CNNM